MSDDTISTINIEQFITALTGLKVGIMLDHSVKNELNYYTLRIRTDGMEKPRGLRLRELNSLWQKEQGGDRRFTHPAQLLVAFGNWVFNNQKAIAKAVPPAPHMTKKPSRGPFGWGED